MTEEERARRLQVLSKPELARRLDQLVAEMERNGRADDDARGLLLDLQTHQVELELQGRELADAQEILEVSRDHYARLFDLAPVGFAVFDRRGRIREINLTAARMLGRDRVRLSDTPFQVFLAPGEMRRFLDHVATVIGDADGAPTPPIDVALESRRSRAETGPGPGPEPQALRLVSSRRSGDDGPECFSALIDISAERALERSKTATEHRARAILDALPAEVVVLDASGTIVMANAAWRRVANCPEHSPAAPPATPAGLGRGVGCDYLATCRAASAQTGAETAPIAEGVATVLERHADRFEAEYACERPNGERWLALTAARLDAEGQGAVILQTDVTDRKRAEQVAQVARQAAADAAQAARVNAVAVLATSLVHELAQPLNAASFFGRAALERLQSVDASQPTADHATFAPMIARAPTQIDRATLEPLIAKAATQIDPATLEPLIARAPTQIDPATLEPLIAKAAIQLDRAGAIVERLRDFLRHRAMRMQLLALDPLIEHAMELTGWFASQRQVELRFNSGAVGARLLGDPVQLEQVLVNLICNGVQAIDDAEASVRRVTIETHHCASGISPEEATDDGSPMVRVTVSDTGNGLDRETANALFDLFATPRSAGLGMGLPISRDIVESHGGRLWVDPDSGGGASLHFMLPLGNTGETDG